MSNKDVRRSSTINVAPLKEKGIAYVQKRGDSFHAFPLALVLDQIEGLADLLESAASSLSVGCSVIESKSQYRLEQTLEQFHWVQIKAENAAPTVSEVPSTDELEDMLCLVLVTVPERTEIEGWSEDQKIQAMQWAAIEHAAASDNNICRLDKPEFISNI